MTDLSNKSFATPSFWGGTWRSLGTWLHARRIHLQAVGASHLSREAVLHNGERVRMSSYDLDGTTFVIEITPGETRRVPASLIHCVEDKHDWGY